MAKDPAFLFYYQDFIVGTMFMTNEEVGMYARIISHLADKGKLSEDEILFICGGEKINERVKRKLDFKDGFYTQKRVLEEVDKRKAYSKSRSENRKGIKNNICKSYERHMENENINEDINKTKKIKKFEKPKIEEVKALFREKGYPAEAEKFFNYYESNGWRVGKNPMKVWTAAVSNWITQGKSYGSLTEAKNINKKANPECKSCGGGGYAPGSGKPCWCWA